MNKTRLSIDCACAMLAGAIWRLVCLIRAKWSIIGKPSNRDYNTINKRLVACEEFDLSSVPLVDNSS